MKICSRCKENKPLFDFYKDKRTLLGVMSICKICHGDVRRAWYKNRKQEGCDIPIGTTRICSCCKVNKDIHEFNHNAALQYQREHICKLCGTARAIQTYNKNMTTQRGQIIKLLNDVRHRAKRKGIPFDIDVDYVLPLVPELCPVLGIPLIRGVGVLTDSSPSVDRINPIEGYVKGNILIVSNRANRIRSDASVEELKLITKFYDTLLCST